MKKTPSLAPALGLALIVFLAGCATAGAPVIQRGADPLANGPAQAEAAPDAAAGGAPGSAAGCRGAAADAFDGQHGVDRGFLKQVFGFRRNVR